MRDEQRLMDKHEALFVATELTALREWRVVIRKVNGDPIELARAPYRWLALRRALAMPKTAPYRCANCGHPLPDPEAP